MQAGPEEAVWHGLHMLPQCSLFYTLTRNEPFLKGNKFITLLLTFYHNIQQPKSNLKLSPLFRSKGFLDVLLQFLASVLEDDEDLKPKLCWSLG